MTTIRIEEVRVAPNSQDSDCHPRRENAWEIRFPIHAIAKIGIGFLVEPEPFVPIWQQGRDFVLHDHVYTRDYVPPEDRAVIDFRFDGPAQVQELLVVQHTNGITQIEGWLGDAAGAMRPLGVATSLLVGDAVGNHLFNEGARDLFRFPLGGRIEGRLLHLVVRKTSLANGFANYRIYPRNAGHDPFTVRTTDSFAVLSRIETTQSWLEERA